MNPIDRAEVERRMRAIVGPIPAYGHIASSDGNWIVDRCVEVALALLAEARASERATRDALLAALRDLIARTESEYPTDERAFVRARAAIRAAEGGEDA